MTPPAVCLESKHKEKGRNIFHLRHVDWLIFPSCPALLLDVTAVMRWIFLRKGANLRQCFKPAPEPYPILHALKAPASLPGQLFPTVFA